MAATPKDAQHEKILSDIQSLQSMEKQLMNSLEGNTQLSPVEQQKIIAKVNQLSKMRLNLYQTLQGVNAYYKSALTSSVGTLKEQTAAVSIIETELNRAKKRLELLEAEKNNKIRLIEINQYYGDKYAEHTQLMKIIVFILVPVILLSVVYNMGFLYSRIYYALLIIVGAVGGYFFWHRYISIIMRDNMNYQEYEWSFNAGTAPKASTLGDDPWGSLKVHGICIGEYCCTEDQVYDKEINKCISFADTTQESFVNNTLTKMQPQKYKADYNMYDLDAAASKSFSNNAKI